MALKGATAGDDAGGLPRGDGDLGGLGDVIRVIDGNGVGAGLDTADDVIVIREDGGAIRLRTGGDHFGADILQIGIGNRNDA